MTLLFGYTSVMQEPAPKKKRSFLPVLTVLFVISYGLMTVLIVEQGSVIQSQGNLIKVLMRDSTELWTMKGKALAQSHGQTPSSQTSSTQVPSTLPPSSQTQSTQAPSTQVPQPHAQSRAGKVSKPQPQLPPVPASDLVDQRRALRTI